MATVVSAEPAMVVVVVLLEVVVPSVVLVVDELVEGATVVVVEVVVVMMTRWDIRTVEVGGGQVVVARGCRLVRGTPTGWTSSLDVGAEVAVACALRCRPTVVVVTDQRCSAWARSRGVVAKPTRLPPMAPISTAATSELHRRDSTNRIGLKTGSPRTELP